MDQDNNLIRIKYVTLFLFYFYNFAKIVVVLFDLIGSNAIIKSDTIDMLLNGSHH